jgi:formylglycine-generating enzyme required for sulfatase activity
MSFKYWRDGVDTQSVATIPENGNFKSLGNRFISKKNPFAYTEDRILIDDGCGFDFYDGSGWRQFSNRGSIDAAAADILDSGSLEAGKDYYIYLCPAADGADIVISANATFPEGYAAQTSRKIGGFHYGHIRHVSADGKWIPIDSTGVKFGGNGLIWQRNVSAGIIPNSVWDLKNRPKCPDPSGMVQAGSGWMYIYQASAAESITFMSGTVGLHIAGGKLQSKYGQLPVTGTEGCNWYNFAELSSRLEMRLPSYQEWIAAAFGNPQGEDTETNYGWTKNNNNARTRTGCSVNGSTGAYDDAAGIKRYAVSALNIVDAVGNVWEWLSNTSNRHDTTTWAWHDVLGADMGQAYLPNNTGIVAHLAGGYWSSGVRAGSRAVDVLNYPWARDVSVGARLACDNL